MSDNDRNPDPVTSEPIRETERTTIIQTEGRSGGSGLVIAIILLVAILGLLFFLFGGNLTGSADKGDINVNVEAPDIKMPNIEIPDEVKLPDVDIDVNTDPSENKG